MKKIITISLVFILAMSLLTACGGNNDNNNPNGNGNNSTPGNSQGTESTPGNNSNFKYGKAEDYIAKNLSDYSITYKANTGSGTVDWKITQTSQGVFSSIAGSEHLYIKDGSSYKHYYASSSGNWMLLEEDATENDADARTVVIKALMVMYDDFETKDFRSVGTETIAGRTCDKFTFDAEFMNNTLGYEIWIDQSTGVCLKLQYDASIGGQSAGMTFECTEFLTSGVTLPKPN